MKRLKQILLFVIHHFFRPIWNIPLKYISYLLYLDKINNSKKIRVFKKQIIPQILDSDLPPITKFNRILDDFRLLFNIAYIWDGLKGLLDHDPVNLDYVAIREGDDCDSVKIFMPILKDLGATDIIRWMVIDGINPKTAHYILTFKLEGLTYFMTNFRNPRILGDYSNIESLLTIYFKDWKQITKIRTIY